MRTILLLFISLSTFAHDDCGEIHDGSEIGNLDVFSKNLEHWSANANQVMNAPCKHKAFDVEGMNRELEQLTGKKKKKIAGVTLKGENPALLQAFQKLTQKHNLTWFEKLFFKTPDENNIQRDYSINPECDKVLCAVDKIWGQYLGRKLLFMNLKYGYNGSELTNSNAARFNDSELDTVLMTLSDLPQAIMPMGRGRPLVKYLPDAEHPDKGPTVWADSLVRLYAPWFSAPQGLQFQTMAHEIGHNLHNNMSEAEFQQWMNLSSWVKAGDKWEFDSIGACMTSNYSMTSPLEDFAETASAYRYNARALQVQCPVKYNFMKTVFKGTEYLEESQCLGK